MNKSIAVLLICCLLASLGNGQEVIRALRHPVAAGGAITPVGTAACNGFTASSSSGSVSYTPHASGDQLFVSVTIRNTSATITSITDNGSSGGSTYTHPSGSWPERGSVISVDEWDTLSLKSSVTSVTVHVSTTALTEFCVSEYSGGSSIGSTPNQGVIGSSSTSYSATLTAGATSSYGICSIGANNVTATATAGTIRAQGIESATNMNAIQDNTGSTSLTMSGTFASSSGAWVCAELHL